MEKKMDRLTKKDTDRIRPNYVVLALVAVAALLTAGRSIPLFPLRFPGSLFERIHLGIEASVAARYVPALLVAAALLFALIAILKLAAGSPYQLGWALLAVALTVISLNEIVQFSGTFVESVAPYLPFNPDRWLSFLDLFS
jgi:hypothetical protein